MVEWMDDQKAARSELKSAEAKAAESVEMSATKPAARWAQHWVDR
jgi:hypothetical protein